MELERAARSLRVPGVPLRRVGWAIVEELDDATDDLGVARGLAVVGSADLEQGAAAKLRGQWYPGLRSECLRECVR